MTALEIRRIRFDLDGDVPFNWNAGNPAFSTYMNMVSIMAICFEKMLVAAVREAMPLITDSAVAEEADAFLRQEAQHSMAHRQHAPRPRQRPTPHCRQTLDDVIAAFDDLRVANKPLKYRLAYTADLEATFTPVFKLMLDNDDTLFAPGDDRVASLFLWHFVEEVEHRSSALIIYDAVVDDKLYRTRVLPRVVKHLMKVSNSAFEGINANVPLSERGIDARDFGPLNGILAAIRHHTTGRDRRTPRTRPGAAHRPMEAETDHRCASDAEPDATPRPRQGTPPGVRPLLVRAVRPRRRRVSLVLDSTNDSAKLIGTFETLHMPSFVRRGASRRLEVSDTGVHAASVTAYGIRQLPWGAGTKLSGAPNGMSGSRFMLAWNSQRVG